MVRGLATIRAEMSVTPPALNVHGPIIATLAAIAANAHDIATSAAIVVDVLRGGAVQRYAAIALATSTGPVNPGNSSPSGLWNTLTFEIIIKPGDVSRNDAMSPPNAAISVKSRRR